MDAEGTSRMFHRPIREQCSTNSTQTSSLVVEGETLICEDIREGWAKHFDTLATPSSSTDYDDQYLEQAREINILINLICESPSTIEPASKEEEILAAITKLHNNKAPDVMGLTSEHIKMAKSPSTETIRDIINFCLSKREVPEFLKQGILTPIYKKGDQKLPTNYRGITVTPILLKLMEHIINKRLQPIVDRTQSKLQSGFTEGTSSLHSAMILT